MTTKLKLINNEKKKRLVSNFFSLLTIQGANYILPLITFPYLIRVLSFEKFGLLAFASALVAYCSIIIDYGYNLTATKEISIHRENNKKLLEIYSSVMIIKFLLTLFVFFVFLVIIFTFDRFNNEATLFILSFLAVFNQLLMPIWFFQGIEKMKYITYINIFSKLVYVILVFLIIKDEEDYILIPIISIIGPILGGIYTIFYINKIYNLSIKMQNINTLKHYFNLSHYMFISNLSVSFYTTSTTFILGLLTNNTIVGYFAASEKIIMAIKGIMGVISQTIYPYLSKIAYETKHESLKIIKKFTFYVSMFSLILSITIFISSEYIVILILGGSYYESIVILKILSFIPFVTGLSNMFGIQTMLNFNMNKQYTIILIAGGILSLLLSLIFVPVYQHVGSAITVLVTEVFITITMFIYIQTSGLKLIEMKNNNKTTYKN